MKVVLHTEASLGLGGQEIRTLDEAGWIAERGWRVLLACQPDGRLLERARARGVPAVALRMRGPADLSAVRALVRLIRAERVSLVHTHSSIDGWVGGMAARWARVPVIRTRHVSIPDPTRAQPGVPLACRPRDHQRGGDQANGHRGRGAPRARDRHPCRRGPGGLRRTPRDR